VAFQRGGVFEGDPAGIVEVAAASQSPENKFRNRWPRVGIVPLANPVVGQVFAGRHTMGCSNKGRFSLTRADCSRLAKPAQSGTKVSAWAMDVDSRVTKS